LLSLLQSFDALQIAMRAININPTIRAPKPRIVTRIKIFVIQLPYENYSQD